MRITCHFNMVDGKPTLWDTPQPDSQPLEVIVNPSGRVIAALSEQDLQDIKTVVGYMWDDEEKAFSQDHIDPLTDKLYVGNPNGDPTKHIFKVVERLNNLRNGEE